MSVMNELGFLRLVKQKGEYSSEREASRAVCSVFATIKSWLPATASETVRRSLPQDASQLWSFAPLEFKTAASRLYGPKAGTLHFVLRVQQAGRYRSSRSAQRAAVSVLAALTGSLPGESGKFLRRMLPPEINAANHARKGRAA